MKTTADSNAAKKDRRTLVPRQVTYFKTAVFMISSIDIIFCEDQNPAVILDALQKAGWQFGDDGIRYELYSEIGNFGLSQVASLSDLAIVTKMISEAVRKGEKATLQLSWPEVVHIDLTFLSLGELSIVFFVGPFLLESCGRFTDFSKLLSNIVCPLHEAGCTVFTLTCTDHFD